MFCTGQTLKDCLRNQPNKRNSGLLDCKLRDYGEKVYVSGSVVYVTPCSHVKVVWRDFPNSTLEIPVSVSRPKRSSTLKRFQRSNLWHSSFMWHILDRWYCSSPQLHKCETAYTTEPLHLDLWFHSSSGRLVHRRAIESSSSSSPIFVCWKCSDIKYDFSCTQEWWEVHGNYGNSCRKWLLSELESRSLLSLNIQENGSVSFYDFSSSSAGSKPLSEPSFDLFRLKDGHGKLSLISGLLGFI